MIKEILMVGAGSFLGGASRYLTSLLLRSTGNGFPWATFAVNILGSLFIGVLWGLTSRYANAPTWVSLFLMVGFCGGFTTFSTFSKESLILLQSGSYIPFTLYTVGSVVLGIGAVMLGYIATK